MDIFGNHYVFNVKFEYDWNNEDYPKYYKWMTVIERENHGK